MGMMMITIIIIIIIIIIILQFVSVFTTKYKKPHKNSTFYKLKIICK